jgi:hypothetical protein
MSTHSTPSAGRVGVALIPTEKAPPCHPRAISNRERVLDAGSDGYQRSTGIHRKAPGQPCLSLHAWSSVDTLIRGDHDFPDVSVRSSFSQLVAVSPDGRTSYVPDL